MDRRDARELPIQSDRTHERGRGDLVAGDIVDHHRAAVGVAHDHVGLTGGAAEIAEGQGLPVQADVAHEGGARDLIAVDVVDLQSARINVAQDMSLVPRLEKLPKPATCQSNPTEPMKLAAVI